MWWFKALVLFWMIGLSSPAWAADAPAPAPVELGVQGDRFPTTRAFRGGRTAYMWGNGLALTGAALLVSGVGLVGTIAANCSDQHHGCLYSMLGAMVFTWVPAAVLIPAGELLSVYGSNRMGISGTRVPHYVFLGGLGVVATGLVVQASPDLNGVGLGMVGVGAGVATLSAFVQVFVNIGAYRRDRLGGFAVAPTLVAPRTPGVAVALRF